MRSERDARGWSQADAVRAMRAKSSHNLPTDSTLLRNWRRWESGESRPDDFYAPLIAAAFDTVTAAFFPKARPNRDDELLTATGMDTLEFMGRLRISDVSPATLDAIRFTAQRLCCEYSTADPHELHREAAGWLRRISALLDGRITLAQHREVLTLAGWVALLIGCLDYDMGRRNNAEATRRAAMSLGQEAEDPEIIGWSAELAAWFALTQGNHRGALQAAEAVPAACTRSGVGVQLAAQRAKAWARLGDRGEVDAALAEGREILERLGHPADINNHFVIDPQKFDFYAMDCCRVAGDDTRAESYARAVLAEALGPDGTARNPMRVAEARLTLASVAVRRRDLELAVEEGTRAFTGRRRSLPSLLWIAGEVAQEMVARYPGDPRTHAYLDELRGLASE
ncbi:XRE family transcriptional regulator [Nocardia brevicatena]|uniref:XRE family transcriptional regulator n=1 Tax=Nocardia brevicatena TaxID=37327 RepID=UPI0002ED87C9|nr:XRE family transcriptional regulator [Nocardia brevicatena]